MPDRRGRRAGAPTGATRYPRTARVNHVLQEVIATELERIADHDPRLALLTVTGVKVDPDLRHATVWCGSIGADAQEALDGERVRLQAAIARQLTLKRTPQLSFRADPAIEAGGRIDEIIRDLPPTDETPIDESRYDRMDER